MVFVVPTTQSLPLHDTSIGHAANMLSRLFSSGSISEQQGFIVRTLLPTRLPDRLERYADLPLFDINIRARHLLEGVACHPKEAGVASLVT